MANDARLKILMMVENGKISIDEANELLDALKNENEEILYVKEEELDFKKANKQMVQSTLETELIGLEDKLIEMEDKIHETVDEEIINEYKSKMCDIEEQMGDLEEEIEELVDSIDTSKFDSMDTSQYDNIGSEDEQKNESEKESKEEKYTINSIDKMSINIKNLKGEISIIGVESLTNTINIKYRYQKSGYKAKYELLNKFEDNTFSIAPDININNLFNARRVDIYLEIPSKLVLDSIDINSVTKNINLKNLIAEKLTTNVVSSTINANLLNINQINFITVNGSIIVNKSIVDEIKTKTVNGKTNINDSKIAIVNTTTVNGSTKIYKLESEKIDTNAVNGTLHLSDNLISSFKMNAVNGYMKVTNCEFVSGVIKTLNGKMLIDGISPKNMENTLELKSKSGKMDISNIKDNYSFSIKTFSKNNINGNFDNIEELSKKEFIGEKNNNSDKKINFNISNDKSKITFK